MKWKWMTAAASAFQLKFRRRWVYVCAAGCAAVLIAGLWVRFGPISPALLDTSDAASIVVVDRNGVPLYEALSGDGSRSVTLSANELPPALVAATIAAEDRRFWSHPGVDPVAIMRALKRDLLEGQFAEGGSTISQQVAKLLLNRKSPGRPRGVGAKVREAVLAMRLEHRFSKREILALYLNLASYGNQIIGAERASRAYFGNSASMLTPAQAAFLAGLPQRPTGFNPYRARDAAMTRQRSVLQRMASAGTLSPDGLGEALAERLVFTRRATPFKAPHFVEMVLAAAGDAPPARIQTTIDSGLQQEIGGIIESQRGILTQHGAGNVAVVVLDSVNGQWLAWEGSGNYFDASHGGAINGPLVPRQPGSALKPFTYALAFENGFTPASVLPDIPSTFPTAEPGILYSPRNYDGRYRGPLLARRALAGSENIPAVALASELGVPNLIRFLLQAGFTTFDRTASYYGLGVTLGNAEVRLDELVAAYSAFARGGQWIAPTYLAGAPVPNSRTLVSPRTAFWITDVLSDADAREYAFGRGGSLEFPFAVAAKTGTSQAYHDNWTVGYSQHVTVGVWVGNFDRRPLRNSSGVTGAGPIFHAVMLAAERRATTLYGATRAWDDAASRSDMSVRPMEICALSGMAANSWCPTRRREWLPAESTGKPCNWHHLTDEGVLTVWPTEYRQWAMDHTEDGATARLLERAGVRTNGGAPPESIRISSPPDGGTYLIDPTLRREFQSVSLRAVLPVPGPVEWMVDRQPLGTSSSDRSIAWPLAPGRHVFVARTADGHQAESTITVR